VTAVARHDRAESSSPPSLIPLAPWKVAAMYGRRTERMGHTCPCSLRVRSCMAASATPLAFPLPIAYHPSRRYRIHGIHRVATTAPRVPRAGKPVILSASSRQITRAPGVRCALSAFQRCDLLPPQASLIHPLQRKPRTVPQRSPRRSRR
jgi:hypothetical protein